ncbi:hypothetical protein Pla52o_56300 [Novipirellula galeiformis]|uniref:Uncharacterized protein n=1 Tax=Novipirellula galeiformis TaxID=2528004 RepID=A0A5C6BHJ8_9BACT|nr:hypothetical protein [Novipirellula galeiformis]TWU11192.1 hypothetical protein Pla52o_56300 [Novipirellula galeiformis]
MDYSTMIASVTKTLLLLGILVGLAPATGCRICGDCEDLAYPAYGGVWQRTRRDEGRVGSLFDPAGVRASELVSRDLPLSPDEKERALRSQKDRPEPDTDDIKSDSASDSELPKPREDRPTPREADDDLKRKEQELRDLDLDEIRVIRGKPEPPAST